MKLWSAAVAPNPRRVEIYLMEKGIEVETENIDLGAKANYEPEFVAMIPARVPVLELMTEHSSPNQKRSAVSKRHTPSHHCWEATPRSVRLSRCGIGAWNQS